MTKRIKTERDSPKLSWMGDGYFFSQFTTQKIPFSSQPEWEKLYSFVSTSSQNAELQNSPCFWGARRTQPVYFHARKKQSWKEDRKLKKKVSFFHIIWLINHSEASCLSSQEGWRPPRWTITSPRSSLGLNMNQDMEQQLVGNFPAFF